MALKFAGTLVFLLGRILFGGLARNKKVR